MVRNGINFVYVVFSFVYGVGGEDVLDWDVVELVWCFVVVGFVLLICGWYGYRSINICNSSNNLFFYIVFKVVFNICKLYCINSKLDISSSLVWVLRCSRFYFNNCSMCSYNRYCSYSIINR